MTTKIKNTSTNEITELECIIDGINILNDVLCGFGFDCDDEGWLMKEDDIAWWERWTKREERLASAYKEATEAERKAYEEATNDYDWDLDLMQDAQEVALGLAGYTVVVADASEMCEETYLVEHYASEEDALDRLEEITKDEGWREGLTASVWKVLEDGTHASIAESEL